MFHVEQQARLPSADGVGAAVGSMGLEHRPACWYPRASRKLGDVRTRSRQLSNRGPVRPMQRNLMKSEHGQTRLGPTVTHIRRLAHQHPPAVAQKPNSAFGCDRRGAEAPGHDHIKGLAKLRSACQRLGSPQHHTNPLIEFESPHRSAEKRHPPLSRVEERE